MTDKIKIPPFTARHLRPRKTAASTSSGQAAKRTPPTRDGRSVDLTTYRLNRAKIAAQEEAVRSGELEPIYLPSRF